MKIHFRIEYHTHWGQKLCISGSVDALGGWDVAKCIEMTHNSTGVWTAEIEVSATEMEKGFEYKYCIRDENYKTYLWEWGGNRDFDGSKGAEEAFITDFWRDSKDADNALHSSPFVNALMKREVKNAKKKAKSSSITASAVQRFKANVPRIDAHHKLCVIGSDPALGAWDESKAVIMDDSNFPSWGVDVVLTGDEEYVGYKYGIYDESQKKILTWEDGDNRYVKANRAKRTVNVRTDEKFRYPVGNWKAAGMAIPVFSIRTNQGTGVGEFTDIKLMVDWCKMVGMKLLQILPVNDTTATHTWVDSYPYAGISVFAMHPMYANLQAMGNVSSKITQQIIDEQRAWLNAKDGVDYEGVMRVKARFFKLIYEEQKAKVHQDKNFIAFVENNASWLKPYAAFCYLRDLYGTPDFSKWGNFATFSQEMLNELTDVSAPHYDDVAIHYFIQYHLHIQLLDASEYARSKGVVLKGDIPIGIYRHSCDAWVAPHLYNMGTQAGAPPDDFAASGQNWGFPTYNWGEMAKDNYSWWRNRLKKMSEYFDVFRIDHILGFFRIWEIPWDAVEGILGQFNPTIPIGLDEFKNRGIWFDYDRHCKPYIREHNLKSIFGENVELVKKTFLDEKPNQKGAYQFKPKFDTQRKVEEALTLPVDAPEDQKAFNKKIKEGLFQLHAEVLFLEHPFSNKQSFNPRNSFHRTQSYQDLDWENKAKLNDLYIEYFYKRMENYWKEQAMTKLPAITNATNMLVCGEDLGMVPDCVPPTMKELGLLSLEIQRMPKNPKVEFGHPSDAPYMSVVTPSSHDMSTIRGWWEENRSKTQKFYNTILGHDGGAPFFCEPWVVKEIVNQHLYSPAMWAIFPLQDLVGMDGNLRRNDVNAERINVPANPKHYWRYRFHLTVEELLEKKEFNEMLAKMILESGRNSAY
jgi:4-alpha-glucanotransferase